MYLYQDDICVLEERENFIGKYLWLYYKGLEFNIIPRRNEDNDIFVFIGVKDTFSFIFKEEIIDIDKFVAIVKEDSNLVKSVYGDSIQDVFQEYINHIVKIYFTAVAREYAVEEFLELKNESWLAEGENYIGISDFKKRITVDTIDFNKNDEIELWCDDGDLFFGHIIYIKLGKNLRLVHSDLMG